jgi:TPR repeat protein
MTASIFSCSTDWKSIYRNYYNSAVNQKSDELTLKVALCHLFGFDVKENIINYKMAFSLFKKCESNLWLGFCYLNGKGVSHNFDTALKYLKKCNSAKSILLQGMTLEKKNGIVLDKKNEISESQKLYNRSFIKLLEEAVNGDPVSQFFLGMCYRYGCGTIKDEVQAYYWFNKASLNGIIDARYNMGVCLHDEIGCEKNINRAIEEYKSCQFYGHGTAISILGWCYYNNLCNDIKTEEKRNKKTLELFHKSVTVYNNKIGLYSLGMVYENGYCGVEKNISKAIEYYKKSAEQDFNRAQNALRRLNRVS